MKYIILDNLSFLIVGIITFLALLVIGIQLLRGKKLNTLLYDQNIKIILIISFSIVTLISTFQFFIQKERNIFVNDKINSIENNIYIAHIAEEDGNYDEALEYFFIAQSQSQKIGDYAIQASINNSISRIYNKLNKTTEALVYNQKAIKFTNFTNDSNLLLDSYLLRASLLLKNKELNESIHTYNSLLNDRNLNKDQKAYVYYYLGEYFLERELTKKAELNFRRSYEIAKYNHDKKLQELLKTKGYRF